MTLLAWHNFIPPLLTLAGSVNALAQEAIESHHPVSATRVQREVAGTFRQLGDWSKQSPVFERYVENLWRTQGWNTEPDQFAKRMSIELARIPPWDIQKRIEKMVDLAAQRYKLSNLQRATLQAKLYRETFGFITNHFDAITKQVREFVAERVAGRPLSPELVAKWTRESEDMFNDGRERIDRVARSMYDSASPEQRALMEADDRNLSQRFDDISRMRDQWAQGQWKPDQWGMQDDPIQTGRPTPDTSVPDNTAPATEAQSPILDQEQFVKAADLRPKMGQPVPHDETTWVFYVRRFIRDHQLDPGQRTAIESIHAELVQRAQTYRKNHRDTTEASPASPTAASDALEPIRAMYDELRARSEALLTQTQKPADNVKPDRP